MNNGEYVVGEIYQFSEGKFGCIGFDGMGEPQFERISKCPLKITLADIDVSNGVFDNSGYRYFPDGSCRERTGRERKPSPDPVQRQRAIVRFWWMRLNLALDEFTQHKQRLLNQTEACNRQNLPGPNYEAVGKLQMLEARTQIISEKLKEEEVVLKELKGEDKGVVDYRRQNAEIKNIIKSINV